MNVDLSNVPEIIKELRNWWKDLQLSGPATATLLIVAVVLCILAWRSPALSRVRMEDRQNKREHELRMQKLNSRIKREKERRLKRRKKNEDEDESKDN